MACWERWLRAGLIELRRPQFEKDGRVIPFRKISLTDAGFRTRPDTHLDLLLSDGYVKELAGSQSQRPRKSSGRKPIESNAARAARPASTASAPLPLKTAPLPPSSKPATAAKVPVRAELNASGAALVDRLKAWRAGEAKRLRLPAFTILHDSTLYALAAARPSTPHDLLAVAGMGPSKVGRFGEAILEICGVPD